MATQMVVPLELAAAACATCAGLGAVVGAWAAKRRAQRQHDPRRPAPLSPLAALFQPAVLAEAVDCAARRSACASDTRAVLHGRIEQLAALHPDWNAATRDAVRAHVAAVMRSGLRRGDCIAVAEGTAGEGFTIIVPGADEHAAVRIAERLRRALAQLRLPQLSAAAQLTARFGVAADRLGETGAMIDQRARRALDAALARGSEHVVPASAIEEILLLPPPSGTDAH